MDTGSIFVLAYCIQIPLAYYAIFKMPMRGQLPTKYENARKGIILLGVLPCAFLSVFIQLVYLGIYMAKVKTVEASAQKAQRRLGGGVPQQPSGGNPFGGESPAPPRPRANPNPANPFGDEPSGGSSAGGGNPFA